MPDQGLLERTGLPAVSPIDAGRTEPWTLPGARLAQITFEVPKPQAMALMPPEVTRPLPCYARLLVIDAPGSPAGPLRVAGLFVGCRHMMMPRNLLAQGVVDGPVDDVRAVAGGPLRSGTVRFDRAGDRVEVDVSSDGALLAKLRITGLRAVDPTMPRWDGWLTYAQGDGGVDLVACQPDVAAAQAFLSKTATIDTSAGPEPWKALRNLNFITACYAEAEVALQAPRVLQRLE